jgi:hypothetical protein
MRPSVAGALLWRRLRGLLGTAIVWAGTWSLVGLAIGAGFWVSGERFFGLGGSEWIWLWARAGALAGALSGGAFSLGVMALDRRGDFSAITPFRFGLLGAITAGLVTAFLTGWIPIYALIGASTGFVCASGSVFVARRALLPPQSAVRFVPPAT